MKRRRLGRGLTDLPAAPGGADLAPTFADYLASLRPDAGAPRAAGSRCGPPPGSGPKIVCITSGKGGTGKSVLTSNLAVHLAAAGIRVMAVDADMGLANLHLLMGMRPSRTVLEVIQRGASLDDIAEFGPMGLRLAAGGSGRPEMADLHPARLHRLVAAMEGLGRRAELVLVDTGAGIGRSTTSFLYSLREILVVTTPDLTAMTDAYAVIKHVAHNNAAARLSLVVNRVPSARDGLEVSSRIEAICRRFLGRSIRYLGHILDDPRVSTSVAARIPILLNQPASPAAACLRGIGRSLLLEVGPHRDPSSAQAH
ncbi:MAG: P-loop NTPase [Acidobacteriota bacterium]